MTVTIQDDFLRKNREKLSIQGTNYIENKTYSRQGFPLLTQQKQ